MGRDQRRTGEPRVKASEHGRTARVVPPARYLRVGVCELIDDAVSENCARSAARAAVVLVVVHEARHADVAGEFADGGLVVAVVGRRRTELYVRPIVRTSESGVPCRSRRGGCARIVAIDVPSLLSAFVVAGAVPVGNGRDGGRRILPEPHGLTAHRGNAAADGFAAVVGTGRVVVFAMARLPPFRLHELIAAQVGGGLGCLKAQPALAARRRAQPRPLGGVGRTQFGHQI